MNGHSAQWYATRFRDGQPLQQRCISENIGVIAYYSLAAGFLTGKYRSDADFGKSERGLRMSNYLNARGKRILNALDGASRQLGATLAQVALAWLMARPGVTAPIASATSLQQLRDLVRAPELNLDAQTMSTLDVASAPGE